MLVTNGKPPVDFALVICRKRYLASASAYCVSLMPSTFGVMSIKIGNVIDIRHGTAPLSEGDVLVAF